MPGFRGNQPGLSTPRSLNSICLNQTGVLDFLNGLLILWKMLTVWPSPLSLLAYSYITFAPPTGLVTGKGSTMEMRIGCITIIEVKAVKEIILQILVGKNQVFMFHSKRKVVLANSFKNCFRGALLHTVVYFHKDHFGARQPGFVVATKYFFL